MEPVTEPTVTTRPPFKASTMIAAWIELLNSETYDQGRGKLRTLKLGQRPDTPLTPETANYCCLGVVTDHALNTVPDFPWACRRVGRSESGGWCYSTLDRALLATLRLADEEQSKLVDMNDGGKSFQEIANYLGTTILPKVRAREQIVVLQDAVQQLRSKQYTPTVARLRRVSVGEGSPSFCALGVIGDRLYPLGMIEQPLWETSAREIDPYTTIQEEAGLTASEETEVFLINDHIGGYQGYKRAAKFLEDTVIPRLQALAL